MSIQDEIESFEKQREFLDVQLNKANAEVLDLFEPKLKEIVPIIFWLKKEGFRFFHPDLPSSINTSVGAIIGRNIKNEREIFVYEGIGMIVSKVDTYDNANETTGNNVLLADFLSRCDLDFALNGVKHIRSSFNEIITEYENEIKLKQDFSNSLKGV